MIEEGKKYLDDYECVSRDAYREIKKGKAAFIYNDWVLKKVKEMLDENNIKYVTKILKDNGEFLCYQINIMKGFK